MVWEENPCTMLIRQLDMSLTKESDKKLREHNLTRSQIMTLMYLSDALTHELSLKELERLLQVSQPAVVGIVIRLEKKGMLQSFQDPSDKRVKHVKLTNQGEQRCIEARGNMKALEDFFLQGLTDDERVMLRTLLEKANKNLKKCLF